MAIGVMQALAPEPSGGRDLAASSSRRYIRLRAIQVDLQKEEVTKDGSRLRISGTLYKALIALLERPGQIVARDAIRDCLWPFNDGADYAANVNGAMSKLRRMLGDTCRQPLYIKTIPRKGYALVGDPEFSDHPIALPGLNTMQPNLSHQNRTANWFRQFSARFCFWSVPWAIGIILVGMFVGVWMSAFWISQQR
jgi:DNA-binding winged helix-turn-helix (wHTH) protein